MLYLMTMLYYCYIDVISYLVFSKCCVPKIIEALHITTLVTDISNSIEKNYSDAWVSHNNFNIKIKYN